MKSVIVTGDLKSCHSVVVISAYCFICRWIDIVHLSNSANGTIAWLELEVTSYHVTRKAFVMLRNHES